MVAIAIFIGIPLVLTVVHEMNLTPQEAAAQQKDDAAMRLALAGARSLKQAMRNPDSFKLSQALVMNDGSVCYEYRSQNGFGGMAVGNAVATPDGKLHTDDRSWNRRCANKSGKDYARWLLL